MPVHHFLVTATVPDRVGLVLRAHQRAGYGALLDAGAASIRDVAAAVTFSYTPSGAQQAKTRTVTGEEFVRGFTARAAARPAKGPA